MTESAGRQRWIIINRVSTADQEDGVSLETQDEANRAYVENTLQGTVVAAYDEIISGAFYLLRSKLQLALEAIERKEADGLVTFDLSRYSRHAGYQRVMLDRITRAGGQLKFTTLPLEYDEEGELTPESGVIFGTSGTFAEYLRRKIRADTMRGRRGRVARGQQVCRHWVAYGYRVPSKKDILLGIFPAELEGKYVINPDQSPWAAQIFERLGGGASLNDIIRYLHEQGVPTARGTKVWHRSTLMRLIRNPIYKGQAVWGTRKSRTDEGRIGQPSHFGTPYTSPKYYQRTDPSRWLYLEAPAIVTPELWDLCQLRLDENLERLGGNPRRRYLLSGLARCPSCGRALAVHKRNRRRSLKKADAGAAPDGGAAFVPYGYYVYHCARNKAVVPGQETCPEYNWNGPLLEEMVLREVLRAATQPKRLEAALARRLRQDRSQTRAQDKRADTPGSPAAVAKRLRELEREIEAVGAEEELAVRAQMQGLKAGASNAGYERVLRECAGRRQRLEAERAELEARRREPAQDREAIVDRAATLAALIRERQEVLHAEAVPVQEKNRLLMAVLESVVPTAPAAETGADPDKLGRKRRREQGRFVPQEFSVNVHFKSA